MSDAGRDAAVIVRGNWVLTMGPRGALRNAAVAFDAEGRIVGVGPADEVIAANQGAEVSGDGNGIVIPGTPAPPQNKA